MSLAKSDVCVLLPAYNEEKNIERVIAGVLAHGYSVFAVDDGSQDATARKLRALGVPCLISGKNEGKGVSIRKGIEALLKGPAKAVVLMDSDGQHAPEEIDLFVEALNAGADLVIGNRMGDTQRMPRIRVWTNRLMSGVISAVAGRRVEDTQCGYRAMNRRAMEKIRFETARYEVESEMILRAARLGLRVVSVPIRSVYSDEVSHIRPGRDTVRFLSFLIRFVFSRES